jgi:hypothetical protein
VESDKSRGSQGKSDDSRHGLCSFVFAQNIETCAKWLEKDEVRRVGVVAHTCGPGYSGGVGRRVLV